ncbi:hypothetical protein PCC8801_2277 [Rippkaea orientalis PCC 8801]|uniref:Uncharacterized protein n=1 Tax=Rippkaea orientalis (strain PCC 8801 / RF-1) TaxID=41431 RepID=B7K1A1_RIPO1|nr:hypothetical protein [Rippkaea orientalis]ACK66296.1 hypothetical protein PCC8801_2277 [Rippkaea orientalis PCC 8801]
MKIDSSVFVDSPIALDTFLGCPNCRELLQEVFGHLNFSDS